MTGTGTMTLRQLLRDDAAPAVTLSGLTSDSRQVRAGDLFIARQGAAFDGHDFANAAVAAGAVAVVSERPVEVAVPNVVVANAGARLGAFGRRFHANPSAALRVVGVTGTNGKTSVAHHVAGLAARGAYIGTLGWGVPPRLCPSALTTADPITLQARLRRLADSGAGVVGLEASSHALHQGRVEAVDFAAGVFTNLSRDHLDYHGSMRAYADAKRRLFERPLDVAVVNVDDAFGAELAQSLDGGVQVLPFGREAAVRWQDVGHTADGIRGRWHTPWGASDFTLPAQIGAFAVCNAAAALAAVCALGAPLAQVVERMARLPPVPGRMQRVSAAPTTVIDYAHTPDALRSALAAIRAHVPAGGQLVLVFGCGGERDRGKRALMAREAEQGADLVVATSDNPRAEDPEHILDDVMAGFDAPRRVTRIPGRRDAIAAALTEAGERDIVLIAGKGHETTQEIGGEKLPFDDAAVVRQLLGPKAQGAR